MANFYEQNFKVLNEKFPYIANNINDINNFDEIEIKDTEEGKVLYYKGACLDNAYKPNAAAKKWVDTQNIDFSNITQLNSYEKNPIYPSIYYYAQIVLYDKRICHYLIKI